MERLKTCFKPQKTQTSNQQQKNTTKTCERPHSTGLNLSFFAHCIMEQTVRYKHFPLAL